MKNPVFVCNRCGAGFLRLPRTPIHVEPVFYWLSEEIAGEDCLGTIVQKERKDCK